MSTLTIAIEESSDATYAKLYDRTDWDSWDETKILTVDLTVTYDSTDYTLELYDSGGGIDLLGIDDASVYTNLCGTSVNSYYEIDPNLILDVGGDPLNASYFPDGYYEFKLDVTSTMAGDATLTTTNTEGFLAEAYCKSSQLPHLLDLNDFDAHESRLQRALISMLDAAVRAGELGEYTAFDTIVTKINAFFSARELTDCW